MLRHRTVTLAIIALAFLAACNEAPVPESETPRTVLTATVVDSSGDDVGRFAGELRARDRAVLSFETGGTVRDVNVNLGDTFDSGDILGRVDDRRAQLTLDTRRAELLDARAAYTEARLEYERRSNLQGTGAVSVASIEQAETRMESARARLSAAQAGVATAEEQVSDTFLRAPFDGEVVNRLVEPSQVVSAGQPILEVVGRESGLEGIVAVPDATRRALEIGDDVQVRVLSLDAKISARVNEIGNRANVAGLFPITLQLVAPPTNVSAGQSIEVTFGLPIGPEGSLIIPITAYAVDPNGQPYVFLINETDTGGAVAIRRQDILLGEIAGQGIRVLRGINVGDTIVSKGVDLLSDGQRVFAVDQSSDRFGN
ncbi:MAG: efflux RND transporter periplasmic adaptor subunit [Hyphomonadaceae bacterium]|nr:efflux RND transporter periplasmic adaptor subunit [Hyphomonadaceae bacterium]MBC6412112.1 efflux RND transporter periplasmic adaptor subunit [Hyphomonadaceae bacterium]